MAAKTMSKTVSTKRKREEGVSARKIWVLEEESATKQVDDMRSSDEDEDEDEDEDGEDGEEELDAAEIFRRHFEARFKPLPDVKEKKEKKGGKKGAVAEEEEDDDEDEEWGGLSGEGSENDEEEEDSEDEGVKRRKIDVVEHTSAVSAPKMSKAELKAFMSARPPSSATTTTALTTPTPTDPSDKDNTANDLALHRLLTESHLLTSTTGSSSHQTHTLEGTNRHRATDLRIQALGGKGSLFVQAKMPMHMRKGIAAKAEEREKGRREGAREGGIILERMGGKEARRDRRSGGEKGLGRGDVGAPGVGRFVGGALKISKKEVREIEGPKTRGGKGGRGGRGGRGGGRGKGRGRGK